VREFDPQLWRDRAWKRFGRAVAAGSSKRVVEPQWATDVVAIGILEQLVGWCKGKGLKVVFGQKRNGLYDPESKTITVAIGAAPAKQVVYLLHECGHFLIGMKEHHERFGMGYPQTDAEVVKTFLHRVACLEEELEAWHRGWKLAGRLGIVINRAHFDSIKLECIRSYMKWALRRGKVELQDEDDEEKGVRSV